MGPGLFTILPCIDNIIKAGLSIQPETFSFYLKDFHHFHYLHNIHPCEQVDLRTVTFDVPSQEILTKDSVTVTVDAVVYFKVFNPLAAVVNVANAAKASRILASTTLRNMLGTKNLHVNIDTL